MTKSASSCCHLVDGNGAIIFSTLDPECRACFDVCAENNQLVSSCGKGGKHRRGVIRTTSGAAFLCASDKDSLASGRVFKARLEFYAEMLEEYRVMRDEILCREVEKTNRLLHNVTSLNAHSIQELYALVSQKDLAARFRDQRRILSDKIAAQPGAAAHAFLNILKNEISLRNEISVFRKLYDPNPPLNFGGHDIHKVILNVANLFFQALSDRRVTVDIEDTDLRLSLDYESVQVALYHLFDNAAKYTENDSTIRIFVKQEREPQIVMQMTSLYLDPEEVPRIFEEGVSGALPDLIGTAGKGLGMGLVRDLLCLNGATIKFVPGARLEPRSRMVPKGIFYARNEVIISFSKDSVLRKGQSVISKPAFRGNTAFRQYGGR